MGFLKRKPNRLDKVLAAHDLSEAIIAASAPAEPPRIHNPVNGTCYHYRDPDRAAARPVCNASGAGWAEGAGGLKKCGLCPYIWAKRQAASSEGQVA